MTHRIVSVVGARPNFIKLSAIAAAARRRTDVQHTIVHTGQHYDGDMSGAFFRDLDIPDPDHHLAVGSAERPEQLAAVMARLAPVLRQESPDTVLVYGDVTSTLAAGITAAQLDLRVGHVEAGLRSRDRTMPEELNRILTDHVASLLFAPSRDAVDNLVLEGVPAEQVHFVGNVMIDVLDRVRSRAGRSTLVRRLGLAATAGFGVVTLHRPSNVDDESRFGDILAGLTELSRTLPLIFPVHPRTQARLGHIGFDRSAARGIHVVPPLGYVDMLGLVSSARIVLTDSGGLQEETTHLGVPCLTLRPNTERPITCSQGTNRLVAPTREAIVSAALQALRMGARRRRAPIERWDGHAGERILEVLCDGAAFAGAPSAPPTPILGRQTA